MLESVVEELQNRRPDPSLGLCIRGYANAPVVQLHTIERSAEFYAASRVTYGSDGEPVKFEGATQVIEAAQRSGGSVLCLVPVEFEPQLTTLKQANSEIIADKWTSCFDSGEREMSAISGPYQRIRSLDDRRLLPVHRLKRGDWLRSVSDPFLSQGA